MTTDELEIAELNIAADKLKQRMMDELQMSEKEIEHASTLRFCSSSAIDHRLEWRPARDKGSYGNTRNA
jgi:hypothetical protein